MVFDIVLVSGVGTIFVGVRCRGVISGPYYETRSRIGPPNYGLVIVGLSDSEW